MREVCFYLALVALSTVQDRRFCGTGKLYGA